MWEEEQPSKIKIQNQGRKGTLNFDAVMKLHIGNLMNLLIDKI